MNTTELTAAEVNVFASSILEQIDGQLAAPAVLAVAIKDYDLDKLMGRIKSLSKRIVHAEDGSWEAYRLATKLRVYQVELAYRLAV